MSDLSNKSIECLPLNDSKKRLLLGKRGAKNLVAIALNPSTANEVTLDPTSRNVEVLAVQNGCDGWFMVNLYAQRTSKPSNLPPIANEDLFKENIAFIKELLSSKDHSIHKVVCCWGNTVDEHDYLQKSAQQICAIIDEVGLPSFCLKLTGDKNPFHPAPTPVNRFLGGIKNVTLKPFELKKY